MAGPSERLVGPELDESPFAQAKGSTPHSFTRSFSATSARRDPAIQGMSEHDSHRR